MPKTTLLSAAALLFALGAGTAYAQDDMMKTDMSDGAQEALEETMDAAEDTMEAAETLQDEMQDGDTTTSPDMMKTPAMDDTLPSAPMTDGGLQPGDTSMVVNDPVPAPTPAPSQTVTVACPSGTTAQPDGTCMITGNWQGE